MKSLAIAALFVVACQATSRPPATPVVPVELAAHRAEMIGWLHEYQERGVFPTDADGRPASVFVDADGVRCPMAELIFRSGHADLVAAVARENNQVRLVDVHDGPLHDWMLTSGLTMDEIALVQGAMMFEPNFRVEGPSDGQIAQARIRGRLETAERALTSGSAAALAVAAERLPRGRRPDLTVRGPVVPASARRSGQVVPPSVATRPAPPPGR